VTRHRVVVTGVGVVSPIGHSLEEASASLREGRHGIAVMTDWSKVEGLETRLAGAVKDFDAGHHPRKKIRSMGRVGLLALVATERAIADAALDATVFTTGRAGLAYGSTHGSSEAMEVFCRDLFSRYSLSGLSGSAFLKFMSHTCAANLAQYYGIRGRVVPTCAACASGSLAVGTAYELIRHGTHEVCLAGGAEESHFVHAAVFDMMFAASRGFNDRPDESPRPFDLRRDGLVTGEGACTLVLERYDRAVERGARILAEVVGYGTNCDGAHVTSPSADGMAAAMRLALDDAGLDARAIGYVNAHATATEVGDVAEAEATRNVFGNGVPVSSTKGHTGHTLGACGALETAFCIAALREGYAPPTRNLTEVDPRCDGIDHVMGEARAITAEYAMNNNFAFGGINTSIVLRRL
jgi:3-oxoacyl-[acyl-carrier-protein] synthase II